MATAIYTKDPAATRSYLMDWAPYLPPGDKVIDSVWEIPDDVQAVSDATTDTTTEIMLGAGVSGFDYLIYNTITSEKGYVDRRCFVLRVIDAVLISEPSDLETQLSALRVALGQKAAKDVEEYQIANRMKRAYTFQDLLAWEKRLTELVSAERRRAGGAGFFKNHFVRPTEPGP